MIILLILLAVLLKILIFNHSWMLPIELRSFLSMIKRNCFVSLMVQWWIKSCRTRSFTPPPIVCSTVSIICLTTTFICLLDNACVSIGEKFHFTNETLAEYFGETINTPWRPWTGAASMSQEDNEKQLLVCCVLCGCWSRVDVCFVAGSNSIERGICQAVERVAVSASNSMCFVER